MNQFQRAQQLWSILVLAAKYRHILTYAEVAKAIGAPTPALGAWLEPVQAYCVRNGLPALTSLIVSEVTGLPGAGFTAAADVPAAQMRAFAHEWFHGQAPNAADLEVVVTAVAPHRG